MNNKTPRQIPQVQKRNTKRHPLRHICCKQAVPSKRRSWPFFSFFSSSSVPAPSRVKMIPVWELTPTAVTTMRPEPSITWVPVREQQRRQQFTQLQHANCSKDQHIHRTAASVMEQKQASKHLFGPLLKTVRADLRRNPIWIRVACNLNVEHFHSYRVERTQV